MGDKYLHKHALKKQETERRNRHSLLNALPQIRTTQISIYLTPHGNLGLQKILQLKFSIR